MSCLRFQCGLSIRHWARTLIDFTGWLTFIALFILIGLLSEDTPPQSACTLPAPPRSTRHCASSTMQAGDLGAAPVAHPPGAPATTPPSGTNVPGEVRDVDQRTGEQAG
mmetsp:Transcript_22462/g.51548  ORF Transcript_22462/g.51548 Transcript_22462/m.51548 type:complete len:109 (-) Transcript_22462:26-352(-)